ncbi:RNA-directed RNA polymerase [ssRNA phage SRR6960803_13]|uniref:RNA-directed RNA polymerase n=1 Tax=ssRNA phage SRR6960803_13 TaxID=2786616 RepID=A0A8S5L4I0_9VIRU|nr:RNA-directed RNA polymerase [ssRNA phage SRR6960803_13]DAD52332.1 TPA_asm: RNA-directed RNA polymerase [ssRNA phage SRR6960803_13]
MDKDLEAVATQLYCRLDTARALSCLILLRHREWDQLATLACDPLTYLDTVNGVYLYWRDNMATSFLRKSPLLRTSWDKKLVALSSFRKSEEQCCETNYRLQLLQHLPRGESPVGDRLLGILQGARKTAARILGPVPDSVEFGFGPGTCFELKGSTFTTLGDKIVVTPHVTRSALSIFEHVYNGTIMDRCRAELGLPHFALCEGNRFTTVPKDGKTDRGICVEPLGNLAVQLGIGRYLKRRLGRVGLHVDRSGVSSNPLDFSVANPDGQTVHRHKAFIGSLDGSLATIDLSSASDTISREIVRLVLPDEWFSLLDATRSPKTLVDKTWVRLEKFSSMGNGFTFELETLLFACIIANCCNLKVGDGLLVYGDDIIIPAHAYRDASAVLEACGFSVNRSKSFHTGLFRESCGGDYYAGFDVRPYFSKGDMSSPLEWIALHNRLRALIPFRNEHILRHCVRPIPSQLRCRGPSRLGDCVLHSSKYPSYTRDHIRWVKGVAAKPRKVPLDRYGEFHLPLAILGCESRGISLRNEISGYRIVRLSAS